jgi:hypothetical protein
MTNDQQIASASPTVEGEAPANGFPPPIDGDEFAKAAVQNMLDLFITPEVTRRQEAGLLPKPLELERAQIIFRADGSKPIVRINKEVQLQMLARATRAVTVGEPVYSNDLSEIVGAKLIDEEEDCGHFTFVNMGGRLFLSFDFHYNRSASRSLVVLAKQFAEAAELCMERQLSEPCVDNLFNACELAARARIVLQGQENKSHGATHSRVNMDGKLGNVDAQFVRLYNKVSQGRTAARYGNSKFDVKVSADDFRVLRAEISLLEDRYLAQWPDS